MSLIVGSLINGGGGGPSGPVSANDVVETSSRVFVTPAERDVLRTTPNDGELYGLKDDVWTLIPIATESAVGLVKPSDRLTVSVDGTLSAKIASDTDLGMVKVGSTMTIDANGVLDSQLVASTKIAVPNEAARLALPAISNLYIVTQTDENRIYYLNANLLPSNPASWEAGPSTADTVTGFKGAGSATARTGIVEAVKGDYTLNMVPTADIATAAEYTFGVQNGKAGIIDAGGVFTIIDSGTTNPLTPSRVVVSGTDGSLEASTLPSSQLTYLIGVTGSIQNQLNGRVVKGFSSAPSDARMATVGTDGAVSYGSISFTDVSAAVGRTANALNNNVALMTNASGVITSSTVTATELGYLSGSTSAIQTQINSKLNKPTAAANNRVLILQSNGVAAISATITDNILATIPDKLTAPSHFTATTYNTNQGINLATSQPNIVFSTSGSTECYISGGGNFRPFAAGQNLGNNSTSERWSTIYLANSPNVSSDEDLKTDIKEIPDALLDVWFDYVQPVSYTLKDRVGKANNVIEVGCIAQDVIAAFEAAGLDWHKWNVVSEGADLDSDDTPLDGEKDDYYSLNYAAVQLIEATAIRRKLSIKPSKRFKVRSFINKLLFGWGNK